MQKPHGRRGLTGPTLADRVGARFEAGWAGQRERGRAEGPPRSLQCEPQGPSLCVPDPEVDGCQAGRQAAQPGSWALRLPAEGSVFGAFSLGR